MNIFDGFGLGLPVRLPVCAQWGSWLSITNSGCVDDRPPIVASMATHVYWNVGLRLLDGLQSRL